MPVTVVMNNLIVRSFLLGGSKVITSNYNHLPLDKSFNYQYVRCQMLDN